MSMHEFYLSRAAEAERDAGAATLANVRDRFLASAATWNGLAVRSARVARMQAATIAAKAAARGIAAPTQGLAS